MKEAGPGARPPAGRGAAPRSLASRIASVGPVGFARPAPGTWASAVAVIGGAALMRISRRALPAAVLAVVPLGTVAIWRARVAGDPGWVVIDEVAGQWVAMLGLRGSRPAGLIAAFALFRLLDIAKPGPVGWVDRRPGPLGVMGDDVVAGAIAAALLAGVRWGR